MDKERALEIFIYLRNHAYDDFKDLDEIDKGARVEIKEAVTMAISALEQNPNKSEIPTSCDDAISRAYAQTEIMMSKSIVAFDRDLWIKTKDAVQILRVLPSVQPSHTQMVDKSNFDIRQYRADLDSAYECGKASNQPSRKGHWIRLDDYHMGKFECSECHTQGYVDTCMYEPKWNFCPNCGARMERKNENE